MPDLLVFDSEFLFKPPSPRDGGISIWNENIDPIANACLGSALYSGSQVAIIYEDLVVPLKRREAETDARAVALLVDIPVDFAVVRNGENLITVIDKGYNIVCKATKPRYKEFLNESKPPGVGMVSLLMHLKSLETAAIFANSNKFNTSEGISILNAKTRLITGL